METTEGARVITASAVRRASPSDAPKIADLLGELGYSVHPTFILERLTLVAGRNEDATFVAEARESVIGVVALHCFPAFHADVWIGRITALVVGAHQRRKGIGGMLLAAAETYAWAYGCNQIEVTSSGTHEPAPQFYQSEGYERRDQHLVKPRP
jgi:N-acetylglutamate synthase-like GNAT family acetyltransferase